MTTETDAYADALAWVRATLHGDETGRRAIAAACDPVAMVDALTFLLIIGVGSLTNGRGVDAYLDYLQSHLVEELEGLE